MENKKILLVAFQGELMCFAHVLLNAIGFSEKNFQVMIMIEGSATKLIKELSLPETPFHAQYQKVKDMGLIGSVCKACSIKMNVLEYAEKQRLNIEDDLMGDPSIEKYVKQGYSVITF